MGAGLRHPTAGVTTRPQVGPLQTPPILGPPAVAGLAGPVMRRRPGAHPGHTAAGRDPRTERGRGSPQVGPEGRLPSVLGLPGLWALQGRLACNLQLGRASRPATPLSLCAQPAPDSSQGVAAASLPCPPPSVAVYTRFSQ